MKNKLVDLNDHLFAQMERISEESLKGDDLERELQRTKAVTDVAKQIIDNGRLVLSAQKALGDGLIRKTPAMLGLDEK